jgi:hypothetical protein
MSSGKIISAQDRGTVWLLYYRVDGNGIENVAFDHRPFAHFYKGLTGESFFHGYQFGAGREYVSKRLEGHRIRVEGEFPPQWAPKTGQ